MSRGERSRTRVFANIRSLESEEWSSPIKCPISCRATTRTSSGDSGRPLGSKVARVTTPESMRPSGSHLEAHRHPRFRPAVEGAAHGVQKGGLEVRGGSRWQVDADRPGGAVIPAV